MDPVKLTHLIYASTVAATVDASELGVILQTARRNNSLLSVTGMLLHTDGSFFQVLEGDEAIVTELFSNIASDVRHSNVTTIVKEAIAQRDFGDWTMGFSELNQADLKEIEGLSDFFQRGESLTRLQPGRAKKLLAAFADGRWRARLEDGAK